MFSVDSTAQPQETQHEKRHQSSPRNDQNGRREAKNHHSNEASPMDHVDASSGYSDAPPDNQGLLPRRRRYQQGDRKKTSEGKSHSGPEAGAPWPERTAKLKLVYESSLDPKGGENKNLASTTEKIEGEDSEFERA